MVGNVVVTAIVGVLCAVALVMAIYMFICHEEFAFGKGNMMAGIHEHLVEHLDWDGNGTLLDIGCGAAALTVRCAKTFPKAIYQKEEVSILEQKWNQMWSLWEEGQADSPYAELMTYQSEVSNGGHDQYFFNVENTEDLQKEMAALNTILPIKLKNNLERAYKAYLALEEKENDEKSKGILEECDDILYENEEALNCILREYANKIEL